MTSISSTGMAVRGNLLFAPGPSPILLQSLECNGTEDSLADCRHAGWGITPTCYYGRDAGVICGKWFS